MNNVQYVKHCCYVSHLIHTPQVSLDTLLSDIVESYGIGWIYIPAT